MMILYVFCGLLIQCSNVVFCAAENTSRFPYLSRLPKTSLIRHMCLKSPKNSPVDPAILQNACATLEKHAQAYAVGANEWAPLYRYKDDSTMPNPDEQNAICSANRDIMNQVEIVMEAAQPILKILLRNRGYSSEVFEDYLTHNGCLKAGTQSEIGRFIWTKDAQEKGILYKFLDLVQCEHKIKNACDDQTRKKNSEQAQEIEADFAKNNDPEMEAAFSEAFAE